MCVPGQIIHSFLTFFCPHRGRISCSISALTRIVFPVLALPFREHGACRHSHFPSHWPAIHAQSAFTTCTQPAFSLHTQICPINTAGEADNHHVSNKRVMNQCSWGGMWDDVHVPSGGGQAPALEASCTRVGSCRVLPFGRVRKVLGQVQRLYMYFLQPLRETALK